MDTSLLAALPPAYGDPDLPYRIRQAVRDSGRKLVVLDDDPTGVQTVHDTAVLTRWDAAMFERELRAPSPLFFVLTNSRAKGRDEAIALNQSVTRSVREAARRAGTGVVFVSRGDSTLRGHFPDETDILSRAMNGVDGVILCPAFIEGGRITIDGVHYVNEPGGLTPVGDTEFARDATFGFRSSFLPDWVEEKSGGRIAASSVRIIKLSDLREGGPDRVASLLERVTEGQIAVLDAVSYRDIEVASLGILQSEARGKRFVYRCGASLVRVRAGLGARPLLSRGDLLGAGFDPERPARGLVVVGSHVQRTTEQLERLLALPDTSGVEVSVASILESEASRMATVTAARGAVEEALRGRRTPVVFSSRQVVGGADRRHLEIGVQVSRALVDIVRDLGEKPDFILSKGGITSSDIATEALSVRRAIVMGQARAGVSVWRLGPETALAGVPYIVFPGNVGEPDTLANLVNELCEGSPAVRAP